MNTIGPMPRHLKNFSWYAPHQAWLAEKGLPHHDFPKGTKAVRADLRGANLTRLDLREACLSGAYLSRADLSRADLREACLSGADLSGADLSRADLRDACLSGAYLRGADLSGADLSGADLSGAYLRGADLSGADLREARLCEACLLEVDLSATDLRAADLSETNLRHASLCKADLSGCIGLPAAPIVEGLDRKVYEAVTDGGSLEMDIWHSCETVHCRGGWAIHLAGESGKEFERVYGSSVAAALIYHASTGRVPDFYATNEDAMADITKCAGAP